MTGACPAALGFAAARSGGGSPGSSQVTALDLERARRGDQEAQDAVISALWPLLVGESHRYGRRGGAEDELLGEAAAALWEAVVAYDPRRHKTDPERYLANHVHQRVRRAYLAERGYTRGSSVIPLPAPPTRWTEAADPTALAALSWVEWRIDLESAIASQRPADQAHLASLRRVMGVEGPHDFVQPQDGTMRKQWQRARARLRATLRGPGSPVSRRKS